MTFKGTGKQFKRFELVEVKDYASKPFLAIITKIFSIPL